MKSFFLFVEAITHKNELINWLDIAYKNPHDLTTISIFADWLSDQPDVILRELGNKLQVASDDDPWKKGRIKVSEKPEDPSFVKREKFNTLSQFTHSKKIWNKLENVFGDEDSSNGNFISFLNSDERINLEVNYPYVVVDNDHENPYRIDEFEREFIEYPGAEEALLYYCVYLLVRREFEMHASSINNPTKNRELRDAVKQIDDMKRIIYNVSSYNRQHFNFENLIKNIEDLIKKFGKEIISYLNDFVEYVSFLIEHYLGGGAINDFYNRLINVMRDFNK